MDIIRSLASLAYDGRRKKFFLKELRLALKILDEGHITKNTFKGSWAGALVKHNLCLVPFTNMQ